MIKLIKSQLKEYKRESLLTALFAVLEVFCDIAIPFFMAWLVDKGIKGANIPYLIGIGAALAGICVLSLIFGILAGNNAAYASSGFAKNLRSAIFGKIQTFAFKNIDKFSSASLMTRLTTDISNIQMSYQLFVRIAVRSPLMILFAGAVSFFINPSLAVIYLIVTPISLALLYLIIFKAHPWFVKVFKKYDLLNKRVQENIHGIRVVKSFVQEKEEIKKFSKISDEIFKHFTRAEKILAFNFPVLQAAVFGCMLFISWFGTKQIVVGSLTEGQLSSLIAYTMNILMNVLMFSMLFVMVAISKNSVERVSEILAEESLLVNPPDPVMEVTDATIRFKEVAFTYNPPNGKKVLSDISLTIKQGELVGILGGTGSAKTSLVQLIPRLYDITSGTLTVGGVNVSDYDLKVLRDASAMVLQKNTLFSGTIAENLRWGNEDATLEQMQEACQWAQADGFIQDLADKYESRVEQGGRNFSGGQQQRLCIARALLKNPKILIMDDSTSAVDTKTDTKIRKVLREKMPNTTKIIITQRISSVEDADKIIVLNAGRLDAVGTHDELLASSAIYQDVYNSQVKGGAFGAQE